MAQPDAIFKARIERRETIGNKDRLKANTGGIL